MEKEKYDCRNCVNQGSKVCERCNTIVSPSGRTSKPTCYTTLEDSLIRIKISDIIAPSAMLKPRKIHDELRADDICKAMIRCMNDRKPIPIEWVEEYNELRTKDDKIGGGKTPRL